MKARELLRILEAAESRDRMLGVRQVLEKMRTPSGDPEDLGLFCRQLKLRSSLDLEQRAALTTRFAMQLELAGQWPLAVYVLLSLANGREPEARALAEAGVRGCLARNISGVADFGEPPVTRERGDKGDKGKPSPVYLWLDSGWRISSEQVGERLGKPEEEVRRWFLEAKSWRCRYDAGRTRQVTGSRLRRGLGARVLTVAYDSRPHSFSPGWWITQCSLPTAAHMHVASFQPAYTAFS